MCFFLVQVQFITTAVTNIIKTQHTTHTHSHKSTTYSFANSLFERDQHSEVNT